MLVDAILAYLGAILGPDRATGKLWLSIMAVGVMACVLLTALG